MRTPRTERNIIIVIKRGLALGLFYIQASSFKLQAEPANKRHPIVHCLRYTPPTLHLISTSILYLVVGATLRQRSQKHSLSSHIFKLSLKLDQKAMDSSRFPKHFPTHSALRNQRQGLQKAVFSVRMILSPDTARQFAHRSTTAPPIIKRLY